MSRSAKLSVSIVIPNWNGRELLEKHLARVVSVNGYDDIIVADDGSTDGSVAYIQREFPHIRVLRNKTHDGFASTVNRGVSASGADLVVLLNTDVVPERDFLIPIFPHFEDDGVFAIGCMDRSHEHGGIVLRGRGTASWKGGLYIHQRGEVDQGRTAWVSGGSGVFRRSVWLSIGGMDPLYNPFYWEDIDLSYRAIKCGYSIRFEPKSVVDHFHEEGKIKREYQEEAVKQIVYRNQFIFVWKNLTDRSIWLEHLFRLPFVIGRAIISADTALIIGVWLAFLRLPEVLRSRAAVRHLWKLTDRDVMRVTT